MADGIPFRNDVVGIVDKVATDSVRSFPDPVAQGIVNIGCRVPQVRLLNLGLALLLISIKRPAENWGADRAWGAALFAVFAKGADFDFSSFVDSSHRLFVLRDPIFRCCAGSSPRSSMPINPRSPLS